MTPSRGVPGPAPTVEPSGAPKKDIVANLGQLFVMGFDGVEMPADIAEFFAAFRIGGVILFRDNYESPQQVRALIRTLQSTCARADQPLLVVLDQEGGRVQNFRAGFPTLPAAAELGRGSAVRTRRAHAETAHDLRAVGVDVSTVPVADLCAADAPGSIGSRSYGSDPQTVSRHVRATVRALHDEGMLACAKHFPGHGATEQDSHRELPYSDVPMARIRARELVPFRAAIAAGVDVVMTAHVAYRQSPDPDSPATLSPFWLGDVLRQELGFGGVIMADALEMKALRASLSPFECGLKAMAAGCDMLVYYREAFQFDAFNRIRYHVAAGDVDIRRVGVSLDRIRRLKRRHFPAMPAEL